MQFHFIINILITLAAFAGFLIALYIHRHKKSSSPLVCPIGHGCEAVVQSSYSRIMGMPVELLGILYYLDLVAAQIALFFYPVAIANYPSYIVWIISLCAAVFSCYLVSVQTFILKHWCSWCLISTSLTILIAILTTLNILAA